MADNFAVKDSAGTAVTLGSKDLSNVHFTKHIVVDAEGHIAEVGDVDGALDERVDGFVLTASALMATDSAASAGSKLVPALVESTAAPNLLVGVRNGSNQMPAGDAAARPIFTKLTDGTDTALIDDVDSALDERLDGYQLVASALHAIDGAASAGSKLVQLAVESTAAPNLLVGVKNGANQMPAGDAAARAIVVTPAAVAANGGSMYSVTGLVGTAVAIKASAGTLYSLVITNTHSATQYVQVWDTAAASVTVGTTAPKLTVAIPTAATLVVPLGAIGLTFGTAISIAATTTATGATGATASTVHVCGSYK
jgi:hypothetical protein